MFGYREILIGMKQIQTACEFLWDVGFEPVIFLQEFSLNPVESDLSSRSKCHRAKSFLENMHARHQRISDLDRVHYATCVIPHGYFFCVSREYFDGVSGRHRRNGALTEGEIEGRESEDSAILRSGWMNGNVREVLDRICRFSIIVVIRCGKACGQSDAFSAPVVTGRFQGL